MSINLIETSLICRKSKLMNKQAPVGTGMSRWGMLLYVNKAGIYGGKKNIGVHVYHVGIAIYT